MQLSNKRSVCAVRATVTICGMASHDSLFEATSSDFKDGQSFDTLDARMAILSSERPQLLRQSACRSGNTTRSLAASTVASSVKLVGPSAGLSASDRLSRQDKASELNIPVLGIQRKQILKHNVKCSAKSKTTSKRCQVTEQAVANFTPARIQC